MDRGWEKFNLGTGHERRLLINLTHYELLQVVFYWKGVWYYPYRKHAFIYLENLRILIGGKLRIRFIPLNELCTLQKKVHSTRSRK